MVEADKSLLDQVNGKLSFKKYLDGSVDRSTILCNFCSKEFSYNQSKKKGNPKEDEPKEDRLVCAYGSLKPRLLLLDAHPLGKEWIP